MTDGIARDLARLETRVEGKVSKELYERDMVELRGDFADLRESYRKLVNVAVGEAIGLLVAIVLIAVQIALSVGVTRP